MMTRYVRGLVLVSSRIGLGAKLPLPVTAADDRRPAPGVRPGGAKVDHGRQRNLRTTIRGGPDEGGLGMSLKLNGGSCMSLAGLGRGRFAFLHAADTRPTADETDTHRQRDHCRQQIMHAATSCEGTEEVSIIPTACVPSSMHVRSGMGTLRQRGGRSPAPVPGINARNRMVDSGRQRSLHSAISRGAEEEGLNICHGVWAEFHACLWPDRAG